MKISSFGVPITVALCGLAGYCFGTGWVRIAPPSHFGAELELERTSDATTRERLTRLPSALEAPTTDYAVVPAGMSTPLSSVAIGAIGQSDPSQPASNPSTPAGGGTTPATPAAATPAKAANAGSAAVAASTPPPALLQPKITLTDKTSSNVLNPGQIIFSDGPSQDVGVADIAQDAQGPRVSFNVSVRKLNAKPYVPPTYPATTFPCTIHFQEAGSYSITVTKTRGADDQGRGADTQSATATLTIQPITRGVIPKIASLKLDDATTDLVDFSQPLALGPNTKGLVTINARVPLSASALSQAARNLAVLNRTTDQFATDDKGKPVMPTVNSIASIALKITLDPDTLKDTPNQLALIDVWTSEQSIPPQPMIVINASPSERRGSIGPAATGPNVEFPEYTAPRSYPDGFNPSDKVDTRVSRLYYFRDAHRVAQIINRDVKSYNYVAVATARRQAEDARGAADAATDNRRLQEFAAIRAAQNSRALEKQQKQNQADLANSQKKQDVINAELRQLQQDINVKTAKVNADQDELNAAKAVLAATTDPAATATLNTKINALQAIVTRENLELTNLKQSQTDRNAALTASQITAKTLQTNVDENIKKLEDARSAEAAQSDQEVQNQQIEDRARENQFRQEVAAEHEDPDTYAPGKIGSLDPVRQVSVSVIGEGEIQLRGPIKGINVIRIMINQIDAPVGQVRVGIHTVQINGEHGDRMEKVAGRIQDYIDHSRFLTAQSAQLLRNAVVTVASRKAFEAQAVNEAALAEQLALCPDDPARQELLRRQFRSQTARDKKYVRAFFGDDFIDELEDIDSEFLHSGNKLLSLHSMDTTSLASALFLIALANNDTRIEILNEFQGMLEAELPQAEETYFAAGAGARGKDHFASFHHNEFKQFAANAKFQSFLGFFNAQVEGGGTLNPLQREFIRLAQIFKSRLVTELELTQRVKERALIETRLGDYLETLRKLQRRQRDADDALRVAQTNIASGIEKIATSIQDVDSLRGLVRPSPFFDPLAGALYKPYIDVWKNNGRASQTMVNAAMSRSGDPSGWRPRKVGQELTFYYVLGVNNIPVELVLEPTGIEVRSKDQSAIQAVGKQIDAEVQSFQATWTRLGPTQLFSDSERTSFGKTITSLVAGWQANSAQFASPVPPSASGTTTLDGTADQSYSAKLTISNVALLVEVRNTLISKQQSLSRLISPSLNFLDKAFQKLAETDIVNEQPEIALRMIGRMIEALNALEESPVVKGPGGDPKSNESLESAETALRSFIQDVIKMLFARRNSEASRRPIDHKKLLDLLVDDVEDKYIDLLEGVRAHTANIDAYIKSVATALDDDFNTQFYYPSFAEIRRASRFHDVTLGNIETTNVLANNRGFAKVEPTATMEFDLPKRDILINEALNGALAMTKDFGALVNDPTFLSMAKLRSGQPTSSLATGAGAGVNTVRNTLPGLSRSDDEQLFSQQGAGRSQFGSAMEALIPDPAVYKFETGTGFEIRPVIQPDGQSLVFHFNYMYTTNVREPVRADEKHLGRVKRHFIDTDVQLGNYELREVSRYQVALKAARTSRGIPLFEDIPGLGILFRPMPSAESSLQENIVLAQSTIFPTLFDLMGLRWAPAVADLDTLRLRNENFTVRGRKRHVVNSVFDISSSSVDDFLRIPPAERRSDLYRPQETIPDVHPDGYRGAGLNFRDSHLKEGYDPTLTNPESRFIPSDSSDLIPPESPVDPIGLVPSTDVAPNGPEQMIEGGSSRSLPVAPAAPIVPLEHPASPGLGSRGAPNRRAATPAIAARPRAGDNLESRAAVRRSSDSIPGRPGTVTPGAIPPPRRAGADPSNSRPSNSTPSQTTGRPAVPISGPTPGAADDSVSRSSFAVPRITPSRTTAAPAAPRTVSPADLKARPSGSVTNPRNSSTVKPSAKSVTAEETPAKPKRKSLLSRLRGASE